MPQLMKQPPEGWRTRLAIVGSMLRHAFRTPNSAGLDTDPDSRGDDKKSKP